MNLVSCDNCATVLDRSKLSFFDESDFYDENYEIIEDRVAWSSEHNTYIAISSCPVCREDILER